VNHGTVWRIVEAMRLKHPFQVQQLASCHFPVRKYLMFLHYS
jgi:hypothetical protein